MSTLKYPSEGEAREAVDKREVFARTRPDPRNSKPRSPNTHRKTLTATKRKEKRKNTKHSTQSIKRKIYNTKHHLLNPQTQKGASNTLYTKHQTQIPKPQERTWNPNPNPSHYTLHATHCTRHTSHYSLHKTHYTLHTTHYTRNTSHYSVHTTHCTLHSTHFTLHTTHYTLHA